MKDKSKKERDKIIEILQTIINSRSQATQHLEISAWAAVVLYLGGLFTIYKYLFDNKSAANYFLPVLIVTVLICIVVLVFVHAQYGARVSSRYMQGICIRWVFQLARGKDMDEEWKFEDGKSFPSFINDEMNERASNDHRLHKIGPWVLYFWLIGAFFKLICGKSKDNKSKYEKIQIIESSLYNLILIPTFSLIYVLCTMKQRL